MVTLKLNNVVTNVSVMCFHLLYFSFNLKIATKLSEAEHTYKEGRKEEEKERRERKKEDHIHKYILSSLHLSAFILQEYMGFFYKDKEARAVFSSCV